MNKPYHPIHLRRRWLLITFPPLAAGFLALLFTTPARASQLYNFSFPVDGLVLANPCTGERITLSGALHLTEDLTYDGHALHFVQTTNVQNVSAVGSSGTTYRVVGGETLTATVWQDEFFTEWGEFTTAHTLLYISQGSSPNFLEHYVIHTVVHEDGTVTADFQHSTTECRG